MSVANTLWFAFSPMELPVASRRTPASHPDAAVDVDRGFEVRDPPRPGAWRNAAHDVETDVF
jgi:hypothetical protein